MKQIAVIGAGVMGQGVAQVVAENGYNVMLLDISQDILSSAIYKIQLNLKVQQMGKKQGKNDVNTILQRIKSTTNVQEINEADIVIENITEDVNLKIELYHQIREFIREESVLMINTSCISITRLASLLIKPENVIGAHFMNPVKQISAIELIKGYHTSSYTIEKAQQFIQSLEKSAIIVEDFPGFVSNRISHVMINEAVFVVQDGVASPETVDSIFRQCYGHKMGPLQTADLIGLDTVVKSLNVLYESYQDPKFRCCPLLKKMVDAGLLGRKSGQGFYFYY